jgi:hypothetical protein
VAIGCRQHWVFIVGHCWRDGLLGCGLATQVGLQMDVPAGLVRCDYVFHSAHFKAVAAHTKDIGQSDHIAVLVDLISSDAPVH